MEVLDLFSAAAGGWSLGMHRAGFKTIAACESVEWRRVLYAQNNPGVRIYDDVCTLTADRIISDLGKLPSIIVGSPPCQDISSANTKGKGVEGERSGLYFQAIRIIGECRPRWFALENSANLRTRGADRVLDELEALGYACWAFVVRGSDMGANHERPRSWIIGCDLEQITHADGFRWHEGREGRRCGIDVSVSEDIGHTPEDGCRQGIPRGCSGAIAGPEQSPCWDAPNSIEEGHAGWSEIRRRRPPRHQYERDDLSEGARCLGGASEVADASRIGHESGRSWRHGQDGDGSSPIGPGHVCEHGIRWPWACDECDDAAYADEKRQPPGQVEPSLREETQPLAGCDDGRSSEVSGPRQRLQSTERGQMGLCEANRLDALRSRADWSLDDFAHHLRVDDGLSAWVADTRIVVGTPRGTSASSLIVEAFGDAVLPQIPEAIGRAILRTETALAAIYGRAVA